MNEEEKKLNTAPEAEGGSENTAAGAAEPVNAETTDDIFASLLDAEQIAADFDKINFEIFGEPEKEFAPEPPAESGDEIPVEEVDETEAEKAAKKESRKKSAKSINTGDLVINVTEKQQKKADREKAKQKLKDKKLREKQRKKEQSPYGESSSRRSASAKRRRKNAPSDEDSPTFSTNTPACARTRKPPDRR